MASHKNSQIARRALFVDEDEPFLRALKAIFEKNGDGRWDVLCSTTLDAALEMLNARKIDLVVVQNDMPLLDGVQFLELLGKRHAGLRKISITNEATEAKRTACLAAGADLFIEKPQTEDGFKSLFAMLDDFMNWTPQEGFQGVVRRVGLQDVIQMECLGRNSSILEVYNEHVLGRIYIESGNIIHAAGGDLTGEEALRRLLALPGGSFELVPFEPPPSNTISGPWELLLKDRAPGEGISGAAEVSLVDPATLAAPVRQPVRITETLVCSGLGHLLFQDECGDTVGRVTLMKEISRKAALLGEAADLGKFDRLELQLTEGRAVVQARPDRLVFVAAANVEAPAP